MISKEESDRLFGRDPEQPKKLELTPMKDNFNNWIKKYALDKWHKVDKENFVRPESNTNIVFFTKNGGIFCGHYDGRVGFVCYGINKKELTDVEVTHWRNLSLPDEYQKMLDDMDN